MNSKSEISDLIEKKFAETVAAGLGKHEAER